jgi:hypothetical protein
MTAARHDFVLEQGATWSTPIEYQDPDGAPINLTGYVARMQIRRRPSSADVLLSLTPAINGAAGIITVTISATEASALPAGRAVYDLELVAPGGAVTRLIEGSVFVEAEVTR